MKFKIAAYVFLASLLLVLPQPSAAQSPYAELAVGSASGLPGATNVNVTVSLSSFDGAQVSGVNFNLNFDSSRVTVSTVTTGSAASSAEKSASSEIYPGTVRVLVAGINQNVIPNGAIANVVFNVLPGAAPGIIPLTISNAAATYPNGQPINLNDPNNGSFTVLVPPATNTPPNTATYTPTYTDIPTATATATTSGDSPTPSHTPQPSDTPSSGATNTSAPADTATSAPNSTDTPTAGSTEPAATSDPSGTASPSPRASEALASTPQEKRLAMDLESSIAATGTAYASIEDAVAATSTALANSAQAQAGAASPEGGSMRWISGQNGVILLSGIGAAALIVGLLIFRFVRRRRTMRDEDTESTQPTLQ